MRFTDEVQWDFMDFIVAATLLIGTGLLLELGYRKLKDSPYRWVDSSFV